MSLRYQILENCFKFKDEIALDCFDKQLCYKDLALYAIALKKLYTKYNTQKIGVLGNRESTSYISILASVFAQKTFIPLNIRFPVKKLAFILDKSDLDSIYIAHDALDIAINLLKDSTIKYTIYARSDTVLKLKESGICAIFVDIDLIFSNNLDIKDKDYKKLLDINYKDVIENEYTSLYIIFTSGTTGDPKGVEISYFNMLSYLKATKSALNLKSTDIISQLSDLTFDLAQGDIFNSFFNGATLIVVPPQYLFTFIPYLKDKRVSVCQMVPSAITLQQKFSLLDNGALPDLRVGMFIGEALHSNQAKALQDSAPQSSIYNMYGPTEATVAVSYYKYDKNVDTKGIVPIGYALDGVSLALINDKNEIVCDKGEIVISGKQLSKGYYKNDIKNKQSFFYINNERYYKTGDIGSYLKRDDKLILIYHGRFDDEIKINGFRVSLLEIDEAFSTISNLSCLAIANVDEMNVVKSISLVIQDNGTIIDKKAIKTQLSHILPYYMLPQDIILVDEIPHNTNGKLDRKALMSKLKEM